MQKIYKIPNEAGLDDYLYVTENAYEGIDIKADSTIVMDKNAAYDLITALQEILGMK